MAAMFIVLLAGAGSAFLRRHYAPPAAADTTKTEAGNQAARHWQRKEVGLLDLAGSLAVAFAAVALARLLQRGASTAFGDITHAPLAVQMLQVLCTNKFVLITAMSLLLATACHRAMDAINGAEELGMYCLYVFLFCLGLPADLKSVLLQAPLFFVFCAIIAATSLGVALVLGKLFRCRLEEVLLAVNANLGGAPSAAAMAVSSGWPHLILPGILVGIWGYVIGTPTGVLVMEWLTK
jgi:uncharacterized membrane protein